MHADETLSATLALLRQLPEASREAMVRMYRQSLGDHVEQILAGFQPGGDLQAAVSPAHRIAGSAGMMRDQALCDVARGIEVALREGRADEARAQLALLRERAQVTLAVLAGSCPGE